MAQRYRLSTDEKLYTGKRVVLSGNHAHYLANVLRLKIGQGVSIFSRAEGEFTAHIVHSNKREVALEVLVQTRAPESGTGLTVCFVPIKGGRLETIIEKATELGADMIQPVFSARSVVDKINRERAEAIAREAAEQCERVSWPTIREPVKLLHMLGEWPVDMPLIYGDEMGNGAPIGELLMNSHALRRPLPLRGRAGEGPLAISAAPNNGPHLTSPLKGEEQPRWAILAGPEGGFSPEEFAALSKVPSAKAVSLGPRILRADTAIITLAAATLMAWGDWLLSPRGNHE